MSTIPWFQPQHPVVGFGDYGSASIMPQPFGGYFDDFGVGDVYNVGDHYVDDLEEIELEDELDEEQAVGAKPWALSRKMGRRQNRIDRVKDRLARARPGSPRANKAQRVLTRLGHRQSKDAAKARYLGSALGLGPDALTAADRLSPTYQAYENRAAMNEARAGEGVRMDVHDVPAPGQLVKVPFQDAGNNRTVLAIVGGGGVQTFTMNLTTPQITFAGFQVVGVDVSARLAAGQNAQGFPNQDILPSLEATNLNVNGDVNLFYGTQQVEFAAQWDRVANRVISGLRANPPLQPNNIANLQLVYRQEIGPTNSYNVRISAALVCDRLYDPRAQSDV